MKVLELLPGCDDDDAPAHTLSVYYGENKRWDHPLLERVQKALGRQAEGFDGLQADFDYATKSEALEALLKVRALGVKAEAEGVGEGPSRKALDRAVATMRRSYERSGV